MARVAEQFESDEIRYADAFNEECAVAGVIGEPQASPYVAEMLLALTHRGPQGTGIASKTYDGSIASHRSLGMAKDVYNGEILQRLEGENALGHDIYSTNGSASQHLQPVMDEAIGFALSHNGTLPITQKLGAHLEQHNIITSRLNDSGMGAAAVALELRNGYSLPDAVERAYPLWRGSFSCAAMQDGLMVAFRDECGIRPLEIGKTQNGYAVASETSGLDAIDAQHIMEVPPGAMVVLSRNGVEEVRQIAEPRPKFDIFEIVYLSRPDTRYFDTPVSSMRRASGTELAYTHPPKFGDKDSIVVVPVPETSSHAAEGYAEALDLRRRNAIYKNQYVGRTFLHAVHGAIQQQLRRKHSLIPEEFYGKDVVFIDDTIVRLNTMPRLVAQAKKLGARSVSVMIAAPPVRFPDFYGIDTPKQGELAASYLTTEQMRQEMKADYLGFLYLSQLVKSTGQPAERFNMSAFDGQYWIGIGDRKNEITQPGNMDYIDINIPVTK
jgi:amidophosphoribosyltransferase